MSLVLKFFLPLLVLLLPITELYSETEERPKVGLVLAGGGALGFAHIGALKVLEELHISIDYIAGTSMGSIVGAAYASGVPLDEMEQLLSETDWDRLFDEEVPRKDVPFRYKAGRNREIFGEARIGFKDGNPIIPSGVVRGQKVFPILQKLYRRVPNPVNYNTLPIPFRAVTADLETGQAYIPEAGDLSQIVRASMSVPGFFNPVEVDGKLLVDGGIVNNTPVDVVLEMGADILIVVELYADLQPRENLRSALDISGQILSLLLAQNSQAQRDKMRQRDILIEPVLKGYSATSFDKGSEIMERGYEAAAKIRTRLQELSSDLNSYQAFQNHRQRQRELAQKVLRVQVQNDSSISDEKLLTMFGVHQGDTFHQEDLEKGVTRIYNLGRFESVRYEALEGQDGKEVILHAKKKDWYDRYFRLGAAIEDDFNGESNYRLGVNFRVTDLGDSEGFLDFEGEIGRNPRVLAELYQPLSLGSSYFIAPAVELSRSQTLVGTPSQTVAEYQRLQGAARLAFGRELGSVGEILFGVERGFGDLELDIGAPVLPDFGFDTGDLFTAVRIDTLDSPDFPLTGSRLVLSTRSSLEDLGASDNFNQLTGALALPYTRGRNTLLYTGDFGVTHEERPFERSFTLGGFLDLSGFEPNAFAASDYYINRVTYYRRFSELKIPLLGFEFFAGGSVEMASLRSDVEQIQDQSEIWAGSVFLGVDSPIIPLYLGFGVNDEDEQSLYLVLGRVGLQRR